MIGKSPNDYPCYRKTVNMLPTILVDTFIHQILFYGPSNRGKLPGWSISVSQSDAQYESQFISMQEFEAVVMRLKSRSEHQYGTLTRWLETTRKMLKGTEATIISETLHRDGRLSDEQALKARQMYAEHGLFPLYLNGAKSIVYFIMTRLLSDIVHDSEAPVSWHIMIERGFEVE